MSKNREINNEYILFDLFKRNNGEIDYKTKQIYECDDEYIIYKQFARDQYNNTIEEMDLIPYVIEARDCKGAIVVIIYTDTIKKNLGHLQVEMFEFLQKCI